MTGANRIDGIAHNHGNTAAPSAGIAADAPACPRCAQLEAERDALRVERDALRAAVRVCERAMRGEEGTDLSAAWTDLHSLLPEEEP